MVPAMHERKDQSVDQLTTSFLNDVRKTLRADRKNGNSALATVALIAALGRFSQCMLNMTSERPQTKTLANINLWYEAINVAALACRVATEGDPSIMGIPLLSPEDEASLSSLTERLTHKVGPAKNGAPGEEGEWTK